MNWREMAIAQADAVPRSVPREAIEKAVRGFLGSYPAGSMADVERRAALFADDGVLEDPVGATPVQGKAALLKFFEMPMVDKIVIHMRSERIIVSGDEAISVTKADWGTEGMEPARVDLVHNFVFDPNGKIKRVRIFFDRHCVA